MNIISKGTEGSCLVGEVDASRTNTIRLHECGQRRVPVSLGGLGEELALQGHLVESVPQGEKSVVIELDSHPEGGVVVDGADAANDEGSLADGLVSDHECVVRVGEEEGRDLGGVLLDDVVEGIRVLILPEGGDSVNGGLALVQLGGGLEEIDAWGNVRDDDDRIGRVTQRVAEELELAAGVCFLGEGAGEFGGSSTREC